LKIEDGVWIAFAIIHPQSSILLFSGALCVSAVNQIRFTPSDPDVGVGIDADFAGDAEGGLDDFFSG